MYLTVVWRSDLLTSLPEQNRDHKNVLGYHPVGI